MAVTIGTLNGGNMQVILPTQTKVKYTNGTVQYLNISGTLTADSIPDRGTLEEIEIGKGVTKLGTEALADITTLKVVKIPETVTGMSNAVFYGDTGLTSLTIYNTIPNRTSYPDWGLGDSTQF